jgi:ribosomal protein S18 acetylase RimI-like enzyme
MLNEEIDFDKLESKKLDDSCNLSNFDCSLEDDLGCNDFIHKEKEALLFQKERQGITYLFFYNEKIVGYVTLAMSSILAERIDRRYRKPVPLRFYPSLLIGRLAVDNNQREKGIGRYICDWCIGLAIKFSSEVGCRYVILETKQSKIGFYRKCKFKKGKELEDERGRLTWMYQRITLE